MVLHGYFQEHPPIDGKKVAPSPMLLANVLLLAPDGVSGRGVVRFLVDTGADKTFLSHADAERIGVSFGRFSEDHRKIGTRVGGDLSYYELSARVLFQNDAQRWYYDLCIGLIEDGQDSLPSLLGRDILNEWEHMDYRPKMGKLEFTIDTLRW